MNISKKTMTTILIVLGIYFAWRFFRGKKLIDLGTPKSNQEILEKRMEDIKADPHQRKIVEKEAFEKDLPFEDVLQDYAERHP